MPLALNVKETQEILELAKKTKKLKQEIESGTIGKVCNVISDFGFKVKGANSEKLTRKETNINEAMICW